MIPATNVVPFREAGSFDLDCIFGVDIGRDRTNNFALSFNGLLAVRTPDDRLVVPYLDDNDTPQLTDVSCLTLDIDPFVFRIPVSEVEPGDLIVTADSPFSALLVVRYGQDHIEGVVPGTQELVRYLPPRNLFGNQFYVRVVSLLNGFGGGGGEVDLPLASEGGFANLLPFLLCCRGGEGMKDNNLLLALLLSQGSGGGRGQANNFLPFLLLSGGLGGGGGSSLESLLFSQALGGNKGFFNQGQRRRRRRHESSQQEQTGQHGGEEAL